MHEQDETFEELAYDALCDYVGAVLMDSDGNLYRLTGVELTAPYTVDYTLAGMPIPWRSDINKLHRDIGNDYARAIARGYNRKGEE